MSTTRRFYFDDGVSRKRWQITSNGSTQTVKYGRLTGRLEGSSKKFKSSSDAESNSQKIIAEKRRKGYIEV
ncbi:MAG: WGR domain-containing protein [Planctomycetes bacterium]|nr:WGR domain-containing protein [Planctomycetota bacterium]